MGYTKIYRKIYWNVEVKPFVKTNNYLPLYYLTEFRTNNGKTRYVSLHANKLMATPKIWLIYQYFFNIYLPYLGLTYAQV